MDDENFTFTFTGNTSSIFYDVSNTVIQFYNNVYSAHPSMNLRVNIVTNKIEQQWIIYSNGSYTNEWRPLPEYNGE